MTHEEALAKYGSQRKAAAALGLVLATFQTRLLRERAGVQQSLKPNTDTDELIYPNLPSSDLEAPEIIDHAKKEFARFMAATDARRWFEIRVKSKQPIGVCFMGDPHVDNPGTNWPLLDEHIRILRETPGMFAIGGNDVNDNWGGRLVRLYADSKMSRKQSLKVTKWLLRDAGVRWLCHILGNHDQWGDGPYLLKATAEQFVPVDDWQARFQLRFLNNSTVKIHMAHDFPGHSQWNNLHGAQKQQYFGEQADIYACAHRHSWALHQEENPHRNSVYWLLRSRGYKFIDSYADNRGYGSQRYGASVTAIIDPVVSGVNRIQCFADLAEAAEFLKWKRKQ